MKANLSITILMAISIFFLPIVSSQEFSFDSPENAYENRSFKISIQAGESTFDVKALIKNFQGETISQIYNSGWKNPFFYLQSAYPSSREFEIMPLQHGNHEICVRLRETGKTSFKESCKHIEILQNSDEEENENEELQEKETKEETLKQPSAPSIQNSTSSSFENLSTTQTQNSNPEPKKIILNSPISKSDSPLATFDNRTEIYILYSFISLCIVIIILLSFNRL